MGAQGSDGSKRVFPIRVEALGPGGADVPADGHDAGGCSSGESFALMVLGDSMLPEFAEGEIIVIEPDGLVSEGSFVFARCNDEWIFRQLARDAAGHWLLRPLNPAYPDIPIADLSAVRGVIIQKSKPGRRRASKRYVA
ncbi:MAG: S24 family peptidase [Burkholderiaceae bacterium]|nr:S24 family peptidase [Burkholderiaceae bacterium]